MLGWVMFREKELFLRFNMTSTASSESEEYSLGGALCDFAAVSPQITEKLFKILSKKFVSDVSARLDAPTMGAYVPFLRKALETNPYLFIYLKFYAECLLKSCDSETVMEDELKKFLSPEIAEKELSGIIALADAEQTALWLGNIIMEDMEFRRNRTKNQLEKIFEGVLGYDKFSLPQRVYILANESGSGMPKNFNMRIASSFNFGDGANLGTIKATLGESDYETLPEYEINTPDDMIALEIFNTVLNDIPVKRCRCCNEFFAPIGRSDSEYCSRIKFGEDKRCAQIGAMKTFKDKHSENPIYIEYNRAYKRNHSRLRNGKLYEEEFKDWSAKARDLRDKLTEQGATPEQFRAELEKIEIE